MRGVMNTIKVNDYDSFLAIVRLGIGHTVAADAIHVSTWPDLKALAERQELSAIVLDGLNEVRRTKSDVGSESVPPQTMTLQWIGEVLQGYEQRYKQYEKAIESLSGFYNSHNIKMMVLKGYALSLDWPKPEHRPCGDIDIWLFGNYKEADTLLSKEKGLAIDSSHHHHTIFYWNGFMVENHYDFIEVQTLKSNEELESLFKELGMDDSHYIELNNEKIYLPFPNLHALFLMRHMVAHFSSVSITLRQVLDWAFFVEKHSGEIDWDWLVDVLKQYHMYDFYNIINAICVRDLGFEVCLFPSLQFDIDLKQKVLEDILFPAYETEEPKGMVRKFIYKYNRWQGNAWKQKLCFKENRYVLFFSGLWAHILRPSSK